MGDGKTVNSPLFDDLGTEPSIVIQGRSQARSRQEKERTLSPSGEASELLQEALVRSEEDVHSQAEMEARLLAAGFRKVDGAWRR